MKMILCLLMFSVQCSIFSEEVLNDKLSVNYQTAKTFLLNQRENQWAVYDFRNTNYSNEITISLLPDDSFTYPEVRYHEDFKNYVNKVGVKNTILIKNFVESGKPVFNDGYSKLINFKVHNVNGQLAITGFQISYEDGLCYSSFSLVTLIFTPNGVVEIYSGIGGLNDSLMQKMTKYGAVKNSTLKYTSQKQLTMIYDDIISGTIAQKELMNYYNNHQELLKSINIKLK